MRGNGSWIGEGWMVFVVAIFAAWPASSHRMRSVCEVAFDAREWDRAAAACRDPRWRGRDRMARAWIAWSEQREDDALAIAEQLLGTDLEPDAAYLAGHIRAGRGDDTRQARARFEQALLGYQHSGRHADASRSASFLSRLPRSDSRFSDDLRMAELAVVEAELSGDALVRGRASAALAEVYDGIGMESAAREHFLRAEKLAGPWPAELAHIYLSHAGFLLDVGTTRELEASLVFFDAAAEMRDRAIAIGLEREVSELALAIRLNRAVALSQLDRLDAAEREIEALQHALDRPPDAQQLSRIRLVKGYVAARRGDPATAESLFAQAEDGALDDDYRWRMALELARSYRATDRLADAERAFGAAIEIIEQLRRAAARVELRPWVLAARNLPYLELLAQLADEDRGIDALVVAESLHARAWLDVVLDHGAGHGTTAELALAAARIRQRLGVDYAPPLRGASLMAAIGDREALVFVTIGSTVWRAHVAHGAVTFRRLPADTDELVRAFRVAPGDPEASARASQALLPAELSSRGDPLYVVATAPPLADVPFAALRWRGRYLIDERPIARLPGLAALRCAEGTWDARTILLGDSLGDLPEAAHEIRDLARAMGVSGSIGAAACRRMATAARGARLLHIAAHGIATRAGRAIKLADGNLTAADVLDAALDPQVVVLSGCATAASDDAESWDGFPSAFLAAGSRYVVATLRSVDDAAAARVTAAYYAQPESLNPIERLAAAQRQLSTVLPVASWATFAAWGSAACDEPRTAVFDRPAGVVFPAACDPPSFCLRSRP